MYRTVSGIFILICFDSVSFTVIIPYLFNNFKRVINIFDRKAVSVNNPLELSVVFSVFVRSQRCLEWKKAEKNISLFCDIKTSHGFSNLNTENSAFRKEAIGDVSVYITEKHGHTTLTWTDDIMVYTLDSTGIEWDEIVRIFEGIKYEEAEQT